MWNIEVFEKINLEATIKSFMVPEKAKLVNT